MKSPKLVAWKLAALCSVLSVLAIQSDLVYDAIVYRNLPALETVVLGWAAGFALLWALLLFAGRFVRIKGRFRKKDGTSEEYVIFGRPKG